MGAPPETASRSVAAVLDTSMRCSLAYLSTVQYIVGTPIQWVMRSDVMAVRSDAGSKRGSSTSVPPRWKYASICAVCAVA
jgi:hypothetical protein